MNKPGVLVVVPHSGVAIPPELSLESLSEDFAGLARNVDWHTDWLYDFRDLLGGRQIIFPFCSLVLEANRRPELLDDSVPLRDVLGRPVYRPGQEPSTALRRDLAAKYLVPFHQAIEQAILAGADVLLDGHATVTARGVADNQIDLMNFQHSRLDDGPVQFCPDALLEAYAAELRTRLPDVKVTVNASEYASVYGHVCAAHAINAPGRVGARVPALLQETNQRLYLNPDGTPNLLNLNRLRRAFAESLAAALGRTQPRKGSAAP